MLQDSIIVLKELLNDFRRELSDLNAKIYFNSLHIREAEERLKLYDGEESDDFKIFSPRSMTEQIREKIDNVIFSKDELVSEGNHLKVEKEVLQKKIEHLEELVKHVDINYSILTFQEKDRQRISRELHDTSLQSLTYLVHMIELCGMHIDNEPQKAKMELLVISCSLREIIDEIREIIFDLRPVTFTNFGLKDAFERLFEKINEKNEYEIVCSIDDVLFENELILLYLYRVVQEGLNNIVKHANARKIYFGFKVINSVCFVDLDDDGQGFDIDISLRDKKHYGLSFIRERIDELNGIVRISSVRGEGTKIHIEIPV